MQKSSDLKPCPFCGRRAMKTSWYSPDADVLYQVGCSDKSGECVILPQTGWYKDEKKPAEMWNRRANDEN